MRKKICDAVKKRDGLIIWMPSVIELCLVSKLQPLSYAMRPQNFPEMKSSNMSPVAVQQRTISSTIPNNSWKEIRNIQSYTESII